MKQVTLNIKDDKYNFFLELVKNLDFVASVETETRSKKEVLKGLEDAVKEVKEIKKGRKKSVPLSDFLNEL